MDVVALQAAKADAAKKYLSRGVTASGDTTGAKDTAALNAALTAGGRVYGISGSTYYINGPLTLPSNTALDMAGAVVHLVASAAGNMLRTSATVAARTTADAATTASSATLTSATANFTSADIGSAIGIVGAAQGGATWYGTITAVTNSTTATVSNTADVTVSGAALSIFATRNANISVRGGTWIVDGTMPDGHQPTSTAFNSFASCFRRVDGLTIRDMIWQSSGTAGLGGRFTLSLADVTNFLVENITFNGTAGDGVHVMGPASGGFINSIVGATGDDMVVISTQDSNTPYITDTQGNLFGIQTRGITGKGTYRTFKIYDLGVNKKFTTSHLSVESVRGTSNNSGVAILGNAYITDELQIRDITVTTGGSQPVVEISTAQYVNSVLIDGVAWSSPLVASNGIISLDTMRGSVKIRNVAMNTNPAGTNLGVRILNGQGGATWGSVFDIEGVYAVKGSTVAPATFHAVYLNASGIIQALTLRGINSLPTTSGSVLFFNSSGCTVNQINVSDVVCSGSNLIQAPANTPALAVRCTNLTVAGTNLASVGGPLTLELVNCDVNTSGAVVAAVGAAATPVRVMAHNFTQAGAGTGLSRDSTQALSANGAGFPVDLSILTPSDQDMVRNTNGALACGTGIALFHTGGTGNGWKNLYSGTTY